MTNLLEKLKFKRLTIRNIGEDVEKPKFSYTAGGNIK